mmetsp:Transcript_37076/g.85620  ORF Transcript_37076/g.85620 Transcript_37076/m.85620 type:complete len:321 (+) Transcript_37076:61-1023(+)
MSQSLVAQCNKEVADEALLEAPSGLAEGGTDRSLDQMLQQLLVVGTAGERAGAASEARATSGPKGVRARHARETLDILAAGGYNPMAGSGWVDLQPAVLQAVEASTFYPEANFHCQSTTSCSSSWLQAGPPSIQVACTTSLAAAAEIAAGGRTPGVLNFASARNPGGGFTTGAEAQEESLARSSALYPCLSKHFTSFFVPRRQEASGAYTHDTIFSPQVPVIRDSHGALLEQPFLVDFVTSAAPNVGSMQKVHGDKAEAVASTALQERAGRVLEGCFQHVTFAVLDPKMAHVFADTFNTRLLGDQNATDKPSKGNQRSRR